MNVRRTILFLVFMTCAISVAAALEGTGGGILTEHALLPGESASDIPSRNETFGQRGDTTWYGSYQVIEGEYYAQAGATKGEVMWTFDRGNGPFNPPLGVIPDGEGWQVLDLTEGRGLDFRVIDSTLDLGEEVPPPIISGTQSLWIGAGQYQADSLCWGCGAGYGNGWCRRIVSEPLAYDGTGDVALSFLYWAFSEPCYDATQVYLEREDGSELLLNPYPVGECWNNVDFAGGTFQDSIGHWSAPAFYERTVTAGEIGGAQEISFLFEFISDGGWSDEDCQFPTIWGPFGADEISVVGSGIDAFYDFEEGLQGWEAIPCNGVGDYAGVADVGDYTILDPCFCDLEGNILEVHAGDGDLGEHPDGQHVMLVSPICDILTNQGPGEHTIFMEFDVYAIMPLDNGVLYRPRWYYYPFVCEGHGIIRWSDPVGQDVYYYLGWDPLCFSARYGGTDGLGLGTPVPRDAEKVKMAIELWSSCEAFTIDPCSGYTNATPLLDNLAVGVTEGINAPIVSFPNGGLFQDVGSWPSDLFDHRAPGPANVSLDLNMDTPPGSAPDVCGDSLTIQGPVPTSNPNTHWEAKLWWRIAQRAPLQSDVNQGIETAYKIWKDRVSDGHAIDRPDRPEFTWGQMDSVQIGPVTRRDRFLSDFREDDDDFAGEGNEANEMLPDDIFFPGTRIEYFVTANYATTPNIVYWCPDTTGGYYREFEVLPGLRTAHVPNCGGTGFDYCVFQPATLYIDAFGRGSQLFIENALRTVLNGLDPCVEAEGCAIPRDRNWDRYDYGDPSSNWNAPFVRGSVPGSNNGMTLNQILGYRTILVNSGSLGDGAMQDEDFALFADWLVLPDCDANLHRQVFVMNGDKAGQLLERPGGVGIEGHGMAFLNDVLGATLLCDAFNGFTDDPGCGERNSSFCVRWLPVAGGPFGTEIDVDAYGNFCPYLYGFNVYGLNGGTANRYYAAEDGAKEMEYAQVVNEDLGGSGNYRVGLDGVSWHHRTARAGPGGDESDAWCPRDLPSIVDASISEIGALLQWGHGVENNDAIPKLSSAEELGECEGTWTLGASVDDEAGVRVNRLFQNQPNPFNPTTIVRFSLAQSGPVEIEIFDVHGRRVRTLVEQRMEAGVHAATWDGTNDRRTHVGSGIYWCRMTAGRFVSNMKMLILK